MKKSLAIIMVVFVAACAGAKSPAQRMFVAQSNLNSALHVAVVYARQPVCTPIIVHQCADRVVKAQIKKYAESAGRAVALAKTGRGTVTEGETSARIVAATAAVTQLVTYLAQKGIIK